MTTLARPTTILPLIAAGAVALTATSATAGDPRTCTYRDVRLANACANNASVREYLLDPQTGSVDAYLDVPPIYRGWDPGEEEALSRILGMPPVEAAPVAPTPVRTGPIRPRSRLSEAQVRAAGRRAVLDELRDPASAQFRRVRRIMHGNGTTMFCGEVNGRNAYGGYAGFVRFEAGVRIEGQASAQVDSRDGMTGAYFGAAWNQFCGRIAGTPVEF